MPADDEAKPVGTSPRLRDQPALTTSSGRSWLILAGLLALVAIAVFVPMTAMSPPGVATFGIIAVVVLYALIIAARLIVPPGRARLGLMAACMLAMAAIALGGVIIVAASQ